MSWYKTQNVVLQERAALAQVQKKKYHSIHNAVTDPSLSVADL